MTTETLPDHIKCPEARPIQPIPVEKDGNKMAALRDPLMLTTKTMVVPPQVVGLVQMFKGELSLEDISNKTNAPYEMLVKLVQNLDEIGLLWGPTFDALEKEWHDKLEASQSFPMMASRSLGEDANAGKKFIDEKLDAAPVPELSTPPRALITTHMDYQRGGNLYASTYAAWRGQTPPDRVVIFGANHFGLGDGVVLSPYGFETLLGAVGTDTAVVDAIKETLGRPVVVDHLDHLAEHSIELQLPWIQHALGDVPVVAALIPNPLDELKRDAADTAPVRTNDFFDALKGALDKVGGTTWFVAATELSHVGPQFGEPKQIDDQRKDEVERHDREMLGTFCNGDAEEFFGAFKWNKNPTRWTGLGSLMGILTMVDDATPQLVGYEQFGDEHLNVLVSAASLICP